jgi:serine/threonine-protein kinase
MSISETEITQLTGTLFAGRYLLEEYVGHGGLAAVFRACDDAGRTVAIKMLLPALRPYLHSQPYLRQQFDIEREVARRIQNEGIVRIYDMGNGDDGSPYVAAEFLEGASLADLAMTVPSERLSPNIAAAALEQLLATLASAHAVGIHHRDLKPSNVFVTKDGCLKVLDFGIASVTSTRRERLSHTTASGAMLTGTPQYCAPEVARGDARPDGVLLDVWGAGAVMFKALSGETVHGGETEMQVVFRAATVPARLLRDVCSGAPPNLAELVDRALRFEPTERWPSASDMREALLCAATDGFTVGNEGVTELRGAVQHWLATRGVRVSHEAS